MQSDKKKSLGVRSGVNRFLAFIILLLGHVLIYKTRYSIAVVGQCHMSLNDKIFCEVFLKLRQYIHFLSELKPTVLVTVSSPKKNGL
jgi:hypothetical protein